LLVLYNSSVILCALYDSVVKPRRHRRHGVAQSFFLKSNEVPVSTTTSSPEVVFKNSLRVE
jgi:hypothetical protein